MRLCRDKGDAFHITACMGMNIRIEQGYMGDLGGHFYPA